MIAPRALLKASALFVLPVLSFAAVMGGGGSEVGNGGSGVILPDDRVVLADPWFPRTGEASLGDLSPLLTAELERIGKILVRLGATVAPPKLPWRDGSPFKDRILSRSGRSLFISEAVLSRRVEFHFVAELPKDCAYTNSEDLRPIDGRLVSLACTQGPMTWIQKDLFARMNVREQAKLLVHERLHAQPTQIPHEMIADITDGLETLLALYQRQMSGERPRLVPSEVDQIERLIKRITQTGLADGRAEEDFEFIDHWKVSPQGGGLVHQNAKVDPTAYVGVATLLGDGSNLAQNSVVLDTSCYLAACLMEPGATLLGSTVEPEFGPSFGFTPMIMSMGKDSFIESSSFMGRFSSIAGVLNTLRVDDGAKVVQSSISGARDIRLESSASLLRTALILNSPDSIRVKFWMESKSSWNNSFAALVFPAGLASNDIEIRIPALKTLDFEGRPICDSSRVLVVTQSVQVTGSDVLSGLCAGK